MRRVLMISPHFPPDTSAGAHRVRLLAPHLASFGWEPTVLTVEPAAYEGRLDPDLSRLVPGTLRVVRSPAWPARLTRPCGIGDLGLRAMTGLRRAAGDLLTREQFDALFITIYPSYPALLGPGLKRRHRLPFVLDYQDPWVGAWGREVGPGRHGHPDIRSRLSRALAQWMEPPVVRSADALTAVSARTYEEVLARVPDARPHVCEAIPLGFDERDVQLLRCEPRANPYFDDGDGCLHVSYVGTVLPKGIEVLRAVLAGVAALRHRAPHVYERVRLHFFGTSNQRDPAAPPRVLPIAQELGVAHVVSEIAPRIDYLDALNVQLKSHALLLMGSSEPHYTPSKAFPALLSGRPLIALYHRASTVVDLLARHPCAATMTFTDASELPALATEIACAFERITRVPASPSSTLRLTQDPRLERWSAPSLAGRLAGVLDIVARPR